MKLVGAAVALVCAVSQATAETTLDQTDKLFEAACDIDVDLRGAVAQVEVRQRLANPGPAEAASYEFDLPRDAVITGLTVRGDGAPETALPISGAFSSVDAAERPVLGPDPALLVRQPPGESSQYLLRLQPIAQDHEVVVATRFTVIAGVVAGAVRLTLPGRSRAGKLTACRGTVRAAAGPGTTLAGIRIGKAVSSRSTATFVLDDKDLAIDAMLAFTGRDPVLWTQTQPLADGWSASVVTVAAPALRATAWQPRRALFVIDGSRSMDLIGKPLVDNVIGTIASALPTGIELEAIVYDRTAKRVFDGWRKDTPATIAELQAAVQKHIPTNGSSLVGALQLAHTAITDGSRAQTMVIVVTDGVLGEVSGADLVAALGATTSTVDVHAIVIDPARTTAPDTTVLRTPVILLGGSFVELSADDYADALQRVDEWLRPSWQDVDLGSLVSVDTLPSGGGFTRAIVHRTTDPKLTLVGRGESPFKITARPGPSVPGISELAVAALPPDPEAYFADADVGDASIVRATRLYKRILAAHPYVREGLALAVLTTQGKVAKNRIAMVKGGGPYERITAVDDPSTLGGASAVAPSTVGKPSAKPNAIAKITLERLFRDQLQPKAFACYQRGLVANPRLAGTILFELRLGRGEVTQVGITGTTNQAFEDCLRDAAFAMSIPLPDFTVNADDQTLAHYPLTFQVAEAKPVIVLGDADSSSPLDIGAIQGGVPNAKTPLGDLRPSKIP